MSSLPPRRCALRFGGVLLLLMLGGSGCDTFEADRREVIARNVEWTVTAVGDLQAHGRAFGVNRVRFEVARLDVPYASGDLYEAGPHDHSFALRYEMRSWIRQNVLRLSYIPKDELPTLDLLARNDSRTTVRWLKIESDELFLVLQLPPQTSLGFATRRWGDLTTIALEGAFDTGRPIQNVVQSFPKTARRVAIVIREDHAEVFEQP